MFKEWRAAPRRFNANGNFLSISYLRFKSIPVLRIVIEEIWN